MILIFTFRYIAKHLGKKLAMKLIHFFSMAFKSMCIKIRLHLITIDFIDDEEAMKVQFSGLGKVNQYFHTNEILMCCLKEIYYYTRELQQNKKKKVKQIEESVLELSELVSSFLDYQRGRITYEKYLENCYSKGKIIENLLQYICIRESRSETLLYCLKLILWVKKRNNVANLTEKEKSILEDICTGFSEAISRIHICDIIKKTDLRYKCLKYLGRIYA